ncbi:MAG: PSD1 domain-containing protein [Verrucomicrobiales bacterium]|nr:PSD1 domain-containing protein [Verrucomicrobiales bacterium]
MFYMMFARPLLHRLRRHAVPVSLLIAGLLGAAEPVDFDREIRPLLSDRCLSCHGEKKQESGLRLDRRDSALSGGDHGPLVRPGKPSDSLLVQVVSGTHAEVPRMPRKGTELTAAELGRVSLWIEQGAPWPADPPVASTGPDPRTHWAFQPVRRPAVPTVSPGDVPFVPKNPIDRFVLSRLKEEGLGPSPEADRITWMRRASLDLTGLPPSPEDVDAFVADTAPDAQDRVIERLLASPHYGEKWGRHWLDAARYADSNGFEKDRTRSLWPWRDWVIRSLNADQPFDEFTRDQLAGDLQPSPSLDQGVATGFLRNSMVNMEGGIEPEKFRVETIIDRVDAVGRTWLGLTIACAQCHSHKFDPISQREYYQFYDFLNQDVEPRIEVPGAALTATRSAITNRVRAIEERLLSDAAVSDRFERWLDGLSAPGPTWRPLDPREWHSQPMKFEKQEDFSLLAGGDIYSTSVLRVWVDVMETNLTGFRLELLNHGNLPFNGPGLDGRGDFLVGEFMVEATPLRELAALPPGATNAPPATPIRFTRAVADAEGPLFPASAMVDGVVTNGGWASALTRGRRNDEHRAVFQAEKPFGFDGGTRLLITVHSKPGDGLTANDSRLSNYIPGRLRLSTTADSGTLTVDPLNARQREFLSQGAAALTADQRRELFRVFLFQDATLATAAAEWDDAWKDWPYADITTLALARRDPPRTTRIFKRGEWQKPTTPVTSDVPSILGPFPSGAPRNRLGLAAWLTQTNNPLTARVMVNRVWQQYFGTGLVPTPEDFGTRADKPSNPELLDWLAAEFMNPELPDAGGDAARPWSLKHLHRLIAGSATYRQSSRVPPALLERDPYNRLLARGPRVRVDAEAVQDIALKASGLLSPKIGGPSVFPPLPDGVMSLAYGPIPWNVSEGDDRYRRAMYTFWKRSVPYPAMLMFDAPTAEQSCVRRTRSNTPLQALTTLNEPTFHQAARWLAWRTVSSATTDEDRTRWAFRQCVSRPPDARESAVLARLLAQARTEYASKPQDAAQFAYADPKNPPPLPPGTTTADLAAWSAVTRAILNLDETITKE